MARKNNNELRLFVTDLMNEEQDSHSRLVDDLKKKIGNTVEFDNTVKLLIKIYEAKIEILEKVLREL